MRELNDDARRADRHYTSVVAPEETRRARELFTQKVLGTTPATDASGFLVSTAGTRVAVELSSVPLTVRNHIRRLFRALGVNSRLEAVAAARAASAS